MTQPGVGEVDWIFHHEDGHVVNDRSLSRPNVESSRDYYFQRVGLGDEGLCFIFIRDIMLA